MAKTLARHVGRASLLLTTGLILLVFLGVPPAPAEGDGSSVRMSVDPTVLPPVLPPNAPSPATSERTAPATPDGDGLREGDLPPEGAAAKPEPPIVTVVEPSAPPSPKPSPAEPARKATPDAKTAKSAQAPESAKAEKTAPKAAPGTVRRVSLKSTAHGFVLTLVCDRPVGDTTYMNLRGPRRLVVDLRQPWKLATRNVARSASGMVRHVVVGEHPDRLRFVVHFRTPPKGALSPEFKRAGNTLTVTVKTD